LLSCKPYDEPAIQPPAQIEGYAPIYGSNNTATTIKSAAPRDIEKGGKIYIKNDTLYQIETGKGIHVISIASPDFPQKLRFIEVMGCHEMAIIDNYLYTNNMNDLVVVDIQNINNVVEIDRIQNTFHIVDQNRPPGTGWFECIDPSKGDVIGWEMKTLHYPQCSH
jgi:hypothetical protein